jgi:hypothetical protein
MTDFVSVVSVACSNDALIHRSRPSCSPGQGRGAPGVADLAHLATASRLWRPSAFISPRRVAWATFILVFRGARRVTCITGPAEMLRPHPASHRPAYPPTADGFPRFALRSRCKAGPAFFDKSVFERNPNSGGRFRGLLMSLASPA